MSRCLAEKTLLLLSAEAGDSAQRLHLQSCKFCSERYRRMKEELEWISSALRQEPPVGAQDGQPIPLLYRVAPVMAAALFAAALIWGESRFLHTNFPKSSEEMAGSDWSQLLEQVSEALFPAEALGQTDIISSGSDWASFQSALSESCSAECQELFSLLATERSGKPERLNVQTKINEGR